jgi:hypothetical protein
MMTSKMTSFQTSKTALLSTSAKRRNYCRRSNTTAVAIGYPTEDGNGSCEAPTGSWNKLQNPMKSPGRRFMSMSTPDPEDDLLFSVG